MVYKKWGLLPSLLTIIPLYVGTSWWAVTKHYSMSFFLATRHTPHRATPALPVPIGPVEQ